MAKKLLSVLLLVLFLAGCQPVSPSPVAVVPPEGAPTALATPSNAANPSAAPQNTAPPVTAPPVTAPPPLLQTTPLPVADSFAPYRLAPANVQPAVQQEPIAADLSNVVLPFLLSPQQRERLARDGLVVSPSGEKEFYLLYEKARYNNEPIMVTSDSLLHVYHLLFDKVLRTLERERFIPALVQLNSQMLAAAEQQYEQLRGTELEEAARRNVAFFAVASRLLDPTVAIPDYVQDLAEAELALIDAHTGIARSPIFPALPIGEDYTQYIPRGHYTRSEELKAYFRCMMWYGRMTFRIVKPEDPGGREETRQALLIVQALASDAEAAALWQSIYEPTIFFVGRSDDLLFGEYQAVMTNVYGGIPGDPAVFADDDLLAEFMRQAKELRPPKIVGMVIPSSSVRQPGAPGVQELTQGFRFMGQRFIPDSYIFSQLVYAYVGPKPTGSFRRGMPKGLDLLAVMGSERAYEILDQEGETDYMSYTLRVDQLHQGFDTLTEAEWTQNLYWSWLYNFFPLLEKPGPGYPAFMQSEAWLDKSLNTCLGSWAELRHDTILYAKQSYSMAEGGWVKKPIGPEPTKGYVEPVPEFYARLSALAAMTREGLDSRGLLNEVDGASLGSLALLAGEFQAIAEKELAGQALNESEYGTINAYGRELEALTFASSDEYEGSHGPPASTDEIQAAVVADVHTDPDAGGDGTLVVAVLEEGVGRIMTIYAVAPIDGQLVVVKGGVFSYYEFSWPASDRLTDEKWREMLDSGEAPPLPEWTASFRVDETEETALREAVWRFNTGWIAAAWMPNLSYLDFATGEALAESQAHVQELIDQGFYEGYHLVQLDLRSFDLQDETHAVVTAREIWWDERFQAPAGEMGDLVASRPEYTRDVIYHLERSGERWLVSRVLVQGEAPEWQEKGP